MIAVARSAGRWLGNTHSWTLLAIATCVLAWLFWPSWFYEAVKFVTVSMIQMAPLVSAGVLFGAWVNASSASELIKQAFEGHLPTAILIASAVGSISPICGFCLIPLMVGLLMARVPPAPVIAFWLASPVTDPVMIAATAALLGFEFAIGKAISAFSIGLFGGIVVAILSKSTWVDSPLRMGAVNTMRVKSAGSTPTDYSARIWRDRRRRVRFWQECIKMTQLVVSCMLLAYIVEHMLQEFLQPDALADYVGQEWWAVPVAVFVGSPAYVDGYVGLPLTRGLIEFGMSQGAAMAFMVSGSIVSIWGALAIFPVLRAKTFVLYVAVAVVGSLFIGWGYEYFLHII